MRSTRRHIAIAGIIVSACTIISAFLLITAYSQDTADEQPNSGVKQHRSYSLDPSLYAVIPPSQYRQKYSDTVYGGIVSHHLLANIDIANFFAEFSDQDVKRVILIGPNHYYPDAFPLLSTLHGYATPFGDVGIDEALVAAFARESIVEISPDIMEEEHAISALVPYIAAYLPDAKIVPIIISARTKPAELQALVDSVTEKRLANTIVIASVDFSHHLYSNASHLHDDRSVAAIEAFDVDSLFGLEIDSPGSLYVLLKYLTVHKANNLSIQRQDSANIFSTYDSEDVTSYVFAHAREGVPPTGTGGFSALFFGDTMLGRDIANTKNLFESIRGPEGNFLKGYDAIMVNLEGAVERAGCDLQKDELLVSPKSLSLLSEQRITHVGIMNNHFMRCTYDAEAKNILSTYGLIPVSDAATTIQGTNMDVAVISFFASPVPHDISAMVNRIKNISSAHDHVIVTLHWGVEYNAEPSTQERGLAHALIEAGADVIIGHHPHVTQPIEVYNNRLIFYSLGNFISDQIGQQTQSGFAVGLFTSGDYIRATVFPFDQKNGAPTQVTQTEARAVCTDLYRGDSSFLSPLHPCIIEIPL